ncbi:hypothetical protein ACA910_002813 [Epithemia clementina (nom. ined.)]
MSFITRITDQEEWQRSETVIHHRGSSELDGTTSKKETYYSPSSDRPKRPLCAYNFFFREQRKVLLASRPVRPEGAPRNGHGKMGFSEMGKTIAQMWKAIPLVRKAKYQELARQDKRRYDREITAWKNLQEGEEAKQKENKQQGGETKKMQQERGSDEEDEEDELPQYEEVLQQQSFVQLEGANNIYFETCTAPFLDHEYLRLARSQQLAAQQQEEARKTLHHQLEVYQQAPEGSRSTRRASVGRPEVPDVTASATTFISWANSVFLPPASSPSQESRLESSAQSTTTTCSDEGATSASTFVGATKHSAFIAHHHHRQPLSQPISASCSPRQFHGTPSPFVVPDLSPQHQQQDAFLLHCNIAGKAALPPLMDSARLRQNHKSNLVKRVGIERLAQALDNESIDFFINLFKQQDDEGNIPSKLLDAQQEP